MAKKPETVFKEKIRPRLEALGVVYKIQSETIRGIPDFLICINGHFVALELKKDMATPPDKLQMYNLAKIEKNGGKAYLVYPENWDRVYNTLLTLAQG